MEGEQRQLEMMIAVAEEEGAKQHEYKVRRFPTHPD